MNRVVTLIRTHTNNDITYGMLRVIKNNNIIFNCYTAEKIPYNHWRGNMSFIPAGEYNVISIWNDMLQKRVYEIDDLPAYDSIIFYPDDFSGCINLGDDYICIDDMEYITNIEETHKEFIKLMQNYPFKLEIIDWFKNLNAN